MKRLVIASSIIIVVCLVVLSIYIKQNHSSLTDGGGTATEISVSDISKHNTATDCWVAIGSNVYDLSNYFAHNPTLDSTKFCGLINPSAKLPNKMNTDALTTYNVGLLTP